MVARVQWIKFAFADTFIKSSKSTSAALHYFRMDLQEVQTLCVLCQNCLVL